MNTNTTPAPSCRCACCTGMRSSAVPFPASNRREFLARIGTATAAGLILPAWSALGKDSAVALPARGPRASLPLKVQPVLTYEVPQRREHTSWRNWGGIQTEDQALTEKNHISAELAKLAGKAGFNVEFLPVQAAKTQAEAEALGKGHHDVMLVYAAGGYGMLERLIKPGQWNLMFLRHDSGPTYLWYEIAHPHFLRKAVDQYADSGLDVQDVVVDRPEELLWRLRALHGLKNTLSKRIVAIGGAGGWGQGGQKAPGIARTLWKLDMVDFPYKDLEPRLKAARDNQDLARRCAAAAGRYLGQSRVSLQTRRSFVDNAFLLNEVMKDLMDEAGTDAITIQHCMGPIMGISQTTACLPLSLLNDEGYLAFCESDFVVIPSGILLHYISGLPVFLNDPTTPHDDMVTLAHCTAPRKMDGKKAERVKVLTHYESDYGAAPKVEMKVGQVCTNLVPDFDCKQWVGFEGRIMGNPSLDICRSQIDVKIIGDCQQLLQDMKGFHWMMSYGNYLRETGYALKKLKVDLKLVSAAA